MTEQSGPPSFPLLKGMPAFLLVWIGQFVSLMGTSMSSFALMIWAYEVTGQATALALVGVFYLVPLLVLSPMAGALVDRSNRKRVMIISDVAAGAATLIVVILWSLDLLQVWHLYIGGAIAGAAQAFQWPAYSAAITMMLDKKHYARANGLVELGGSASQVVAPLVAGALLGVIGLYGVLLVDLATFVVAVTTLMVVHVPQPPITEEGQAGQGTLWQEAGYGFRYILQRPSLLAVQMVFLVCNFFSSIVGTLAAPMILARTANNELILGGVQSAGAAGAVLGGVLMGAWGGPKRRIHGVLLGWLLSSLFASFLFGLSQSFYLWAITVFMGSLFIPVVNGSNQAIWQAKVAPDVQGRVFAVRRLIAWVTSPLAALIAGPLADFVMEPAMQPGGALVDSFGWLVGVGPGAGMALLIAGAGALTVLAALGSYFFASVRDIEERLPDFDQLPPALQEAA